LSTWYYLKCECQNPPNSSIACTNHFQVKKSSKNVNEIVYNAYTKFPKEITSLQLSKAKTSEIEQFFLLKVRDCLRVSQIVVFIHRCSSRSKIIQITPNFQKLISNTWGKQNLLEIWATCCSEISLAVAMFRSWNT
jgi:hypothetical protein